MDSKQLWESFRAGELETGELEMTLERHFGMARHEAGDVVDYLGGDREVALSLRYMDGSLAAIEPGPKLTDEDVRTVSARVQSDLLSDAGTMVRRTVAFADVPVTGSWRYRDCFQILPVPPEAPRPKQVIADHPFYLEVLYRSSPDFMVAQHRGIRALRECNLLLAGLVPRIDARPLLSDTQLWAISLEDLENLPKRSDWSQASYLFEGMQLIAEDFADARSPGLAKIGDDAYYERWGIAGDEVLDLPASIGMMIDTFYGLDTQRKRRFLGWCFWLNHSRLVWRFSQSASYMAIIQAVEALRPDIPGGPPCERCGRPTGPGPTRQFIEFLDQYAPRAANEAEQERRTLYALRSGLTHGGKLLGADAEAQFGILLPDRVHESRSGDRARKVARTAGINWLLSHADQMVD